MSIVTELLDSAGVLVKDDIPSKVGKCRQNIERIKTDVQEMLKSRYTDFLPQYLKLDKVFASLEASKGEYEVLHYHVEKEIKPQMSASVTEYHKTFDDLEKIKVLRQSILDLLKMHNFLLELKKALSHGLFLDAVKNVLAFEEFKQLNTLTQKDIDIFCSMNSDFYLSKTKLIHLLLECWRKHVSITKMDGNKTYVSRIELKILTEPTDKLSDAICSLEKLNELEPILKSFGNEFLNMICVPIINSNTELKMIQFEGKTSIIVNILKKECMHPNFVIQQLKKLILGLNLFPFTWSSDEDKMSSVDDVTLLMKFGALINDEFCKLLIENCLKPAVPSKSTELESFQSIICNADNFHNTLLEIGFIADFDNPLNKFIKNVDDLPANKMALDLLNRARDLMKQDLHQTVLTCSDEVLINITADQQRMDEGDTVCIQNSLSKASFAFPSCHISLFARDLVGLLQQVMEEAKKLESEHSIKLYCTVRSICELYSCVVPTYHKETITNIPQQTAIHHNNCMYIAHCLSTLGLANDPSKLAIAVTFVDLVPELKRLGTEAFLAQMVIQRQNILQLLKEPEALRPTIQDNEMLSKSEKTTRQCLQQLQFLKRVWSDVLPIEVYFKSMGTLLNTFLSEIITCLVSMEDITAQMSAQLDTIFSLILNQSPELFKVSRGDQSDNVHKYVKTWFKFQELQHVLNFNLSEIVDRWANGKGPLASYFSADEIKHFIRALFQNTERRAAALRKIR